MSSKHTANYQLCQWEAEDKVLRTDFNEDNAKIDGAIKAVDVRVDGLETEKAGKAALDSLSRTVSSLSGTVSSQGSTLNKKGNCQIAWSTYVGTGVEEHIISLPQNTQMVVINGERRSMVAVRGATEVICYSTGGTSSAAYAAWTDTTLTLTHRSGDFGGAQTTCNFREATYCMVTFSIPT